MHKRRKFLTGVGAATILSGCLSAARGIPDLQESIVPVSNRNWYRTNGDNLNTNHKDEYSPKSGLNQLLRNFDRESQRVVAIVEDSDTIYVSTDTSIYALGENISWSYELSGSNTAGLTVANNSVYVPTLEKLYNINKLSGNKRWEYDISPANVAPLAYEQYILVEDSTGPSIHCLNVDSNERNWICEFDSQAVYGFAVQEGLLYAAISDSTTANLVILDIQSGDRLNFSDDLPQTVVPPVISEDNIIVAHKNSSISILSKDAELMETIDLETTNDGVLTPVAVTSEQIFVTSDSRETMSSFEIQSGQLKWDAEFPRSDIAPVVRGESVTAFATNGQISEYDCESGTQLSQTTIDTRPLATAAIGGNLVIASKTDLFAVN